MGRELSEFLSAYYWCAKVNSPSFSQSLPSLFAELCEFSLFRNCAQYAARSLKVGGTQVTSGILGAGDGVQRVRGVAMRLVALLSSEAGHCTFCKPQMCLHHRTDVNACACASECAQQRPHCNNNACALWHGRSHTKSTNCIPSLSSMECFTVVCANEAIHL